MPATVAYHGRFAPTPSGPLHFGSIVAALGSLADARAHGGTWRLRMDDLDPPRVVAGAADDILRTMDAFGLHWDGPVVHQSDRMDAYADAAGALGRAGLTYRCTCTRRDVAAVARRGPLGAIYPGTCRDREIRPDRDACVRFRLPAGTLSVHDSIHGPCALDTGRDMGDFVLRRRDSVWAYHLATTVDDAAMDITHVVRGGDLLPSALLQVAL